MLTLFLTIISFHILVIISFKFGAYIYKKESYWTEYGNTIEEHAYNELNYIPFNKKNKED